MTSSEDLKTMPHNLTLTGFYAAILAILYIGLAFKVIGQRRKHAVGIGDNDNKDLAKAIRVHGNFSEYVPLALILFAAYELQNGPTLTLHALGGLLVTGRFLHAMGLGKSIGISWQRFTGTLATFVVILFLAIANIFVLL